MSGYIKKMYQKVYYLKGYLDNHSEFLESGLYVMNRVNNIAYKDDYNNVMFIERYLIKNTYNLKENISLRNFLKKFLAPKKCIVRNQYTDNSFNGTILLIAHNKGFQKDVRVFNIDKQEVLNIFTNTKDLKKKVLSYNYFKPFFEIPNIKFYDLDRNIVIEEFICSKPREDWDNKDYENVLATLFHSYISYYKTYFKEKNNITYNNFTKKLKVIINDATMNSLGHVLEKRIPSDLIDGYIPLVPQHGDLWLSNVLLRENEEKSICLIDWEDSGEYLFFHDLFFLIRTEELYNPSSIYLENYLTGKYDIYLNELFKATNLEFDPNHRKTYFYLYILENLYKEIVNNIEKDKRKIFKYYFFLIEKINNY